MKCVYPVLFTKTDCAILIEIPDFEILTEGSDINNAIEMARDAMELKCISMEDEEVEIPKPSDISNIDIRNGIFLKEGETIVSLVDIDSGEYRRNYESERAGITMYIFEANKKLCCIGNAMIELHLDGRYYVVPRIAPKLYSLLEIQNEFRGFSSIKHAYEYAKQLPSDWCI